MTGRGCRVNKIWERNATILGPWGDTICAPIYQGMSILWYQLYPKTFQTDISLAACGNRFQVKIGG